MSNFGRPLEFVAISLSMRAELWTASDANVGKAIKLAMFCAEQVNGGVIKNARKWNPSEWRMRTGLKRPVTQTVPNLFTFVGDDLVVNIYDADYEKRVLSKRYKNSDNARSRWENDATAFPKHNSTELKESKDIFDDDDSGQARRPENTHEVEEFLREHEKHMSREQIEECASDFWKMNEDSTWKGADGLPLKNWKGAARAYADKWMQRNRPQNSGGGWHKQTRPKTTGGSLNDPMP